MNISARSIEGYRLEIAGRSIERRQGRLSQVKINTIATTETIAVTLQKICNGSPLPVGRRLGRRGLFGRLSKWRHAIPGETRCDYRAEIALKPLIR
jgi:hypothetical protein